MKCDYTALT